MSHDSLPPGPRVAALQSLRYLRDPFRYYDVMERRFGDPFTMPTLNGTLVITRSPEGARQILEGRESDFVMGFGVDAVQSIIGTGSLLLTSGERHRRDRKLLSPPFHGGRMRAYAPLVREVAQNEVSSWQSGDRLTMAERMQSISLDVILRVVFGVQTPDRLTAFREAVRRAVSEVNPAPIFIKALQREFGGLGPWARFLRHLRRLDALLYEQIAEARQAGEEREDVLSRLVQARFEDGRPLSNGALRDQLLTLLVAGHETTSTTLAWAFYELARHPAMLERVRDEVAELGPDPEANALAELPYLQAFCNETLRVHPVLPEFFRTVRTSYSLLGYTIPAGVTLATSILSLHRRPEIYPQPSTFRPERFLERRFAPWEFASFGGGHRRCLGAAFAMNEMSVVLATILPQVELRLAGEGPLRTVRRNATLGPQAGVPMIVTRRLATAPARAA